MNDRSDFLTQYSKAMATSDLLENLPGLCRSYRESCGYSFRDAARETGLTLSYYYNIEKKGVSPTLDAVICLVRWLEGWSREPQLRAYEPLDSANGGADFSKVRFDHVGKPVCVQHGAMNKVSSFGYWRCLHISNCRAGCRERRDP